MTTTAFQLLDPQNAIIDGTQILKSDVSSPINGMAVKLSSGYLITATDHVSHGLLCEIDQRGVTPWSLYDRTDANDLTDWKGKKVGVLKKGLVRLPAASVVAGAGTLAVGSKVESVSGGTYAATAATIGVGTIVRLAETDKDSTSFTDVYFDFLSGGVAT